MSPEEFFAKIAAGADCTSAEVVAGYLGAKEAEFTAVRTILSGKIAGIAAEDIRARLRMSYLEGRQQHE